ncbi:hypothetical protein C8J57DRAFT_1346904, partial [Mycena rebaudengoi]
SVHKLELLEFPTHRDDLLPLASFSGLKALMLAVQDDSGGDGNAPGIAECTLDNIYMDDDVTLNHHQKEPLILQVPSLQYLALGTDPSGSSNSCSASMLEYLSLPALRTLSTRGYTRSPLRSLSINSCYSPWNPHASAQLFGLMPTLADLRLITLAIGDPNIKTFRYILPHCDSSPDADVLDNLRALAAEYGMEIHIGHGDGPNYV